MGLRAPFEYVGYEYKMAVLFHTVLDNLCAHCNTNRDYQEGCKSCPAGILIFACRDYILNAQEEDKHFELYTTEEWIAGHRARGYSEERIEAEKQRDLEAVADYKAESNILREIKQCIRGITPHPFFYIQYSKKRGYERPKRLVKFMNLMGQYRELMCERLRKWGMPNLIETL